MQNVIIGVGYTGRRVLSLSPGARELTRADLDLDDPDGTWLPIDSPYAILYTVPPRSDCDGDPRLNHLLSLLRPAPTRFVYLSTSGVYGDHKGARVDETTPATPMSDRARRRLAAESMLMEWCADAGTDLVILRVPGIYGPGRLGLDRLGQGTPVIFEADAGPGNRVHVDDLAACCVRALEVDAPPGCYNVGDGDHRSSTAFAKSVAQMAGLQPPPEISREEAKQTFSPMRLSFLDESRVVDTRRMRDVLGFTPRYTDPEAGIKASLTEAGQALFAP